MLGFRDEFYIPMMNFYSNCREFCSVSHAAMVRSSWACRECTKQTSTWIFYQGSLTAEKCALCLPFSFLSWTMSMPSIRQPRAA